MVSMPCVSDVRLNPEATNSAAELPALAGSRLKNNETTLVRGQYGCNDETAAAHRRQIRHRRALRRRVPQTHERQARGRDAGEMQAPRIESRAVRRREEG